MRKFLISSALIAAAAAAAPASAQYYGGHGGRGFENRLENLAERIDRAHDRGVIGGRAARILMNDVRRLDQLERSYMRDGHLTRHERYWINARFESINNRLRGYSNYARRDGRYGSRYDRWDD